jgi:hypothetical protein
MPKQFLQRLSKLKRPPACLTLIPFIALAISACTSTQTRFSRFEAVDSSGELREFLLYWNAELPQSWYGGAARVSPIRLKTQCSDEVIEFHAGEDCGVEAAARPAGLAAGWCGDPQHLLSSAGRQLSSEQPLCGWITDDAQASAADLGDTINLTINCFPEASIASQKQASKEKQGERKAGALLRASPVPYTLRIRSTPADSLSARLPELNSKVCGS